MKIALIDVDTSHPQAWIPLERQLGHDVVCIWDGGTVHPAAYVQKFASDMGVPRVCRTLEEAVEMADCGIIHGCNWDTHLAKAKPFIQAGKSVLLDKPLAGNLRELHTVRQWASAGGARVTGGSSLRFCQEVGEYLLRPVDQRGTPNTIFCGCAVDEFNYGIHAYSMLLGLMGPGVRSVRHLGKGVQRRVQLNWADGRAGLLTVGTAAAWMPFHATVITEKGVQQMIGGADGIALYRSFLEATLPYLARQTDKPPMTPDELIEAEVCALAAKMSWENGDREVLLSELNETQPSYDGKVFGQEYRKAKYPQ